MNHLESFIEAQQTQAHANIETSHRCALKCPQCSRAKLFRPKESRDYRDIKAKIQSGGDLSIKNAEKILKFFDNGFGLCGQISDPVYWHNFLDFLKLSQKFPHVSVGIHTAASQKNIEWYRRAFELCYENIHWKFGIDGFVDTSSIYRVGQNTALLFDAMHLAKSMGLTVEWHFIVFEHNEHQVEQAKEYADEHGFILHLIKSNRTGGNVRVPKNWRPDGYNKEILRQ